MDVDGIPDALRNRFQRAVDFAGSFFMHTSPLHDALERLCATLQADGIPYVIAGAMAMNAHGYERVTKDVDILLTREGLALFKARHIGRGYVDRFPGSKAFRDTIANIPIDVLITGDFPGDGKPKPVSFPDPSVGIDIDGKRVLPLNQLVELKLASGMTNLGRLKDLADVQELIRVLQLLRDFALQLHPMVREKYCELWDAIQSAEIGDG